MAVQFGNFHSSMDYALAMRLTRSDRVKEEFFSKIAYHGMYDQDSQLQIEADLASLYKECPSVSQAVSKEGITPFWEAYSLNNTRLVAFLHRLNPMVIEDRNEGLTVFLDACRGTEFKSVQASFNMIQTLYQLDQSVLDQVDENGYDAFSLAAGTNAAAILRFLYELNPAKALASMQQKRAGLTLFEAVLTLFSMTQKDQEKYFPILQFLLEIDSTIENRDAQLQILRDQMEGENPGTGKRARLE